MHTTELESVITCAIFDIEQKELRKEKKNEKEKNGVFPLNIIRKMTKAKDYSVLPSEGLSRNELSIRLNEGKNSPLVQSGVENRRMERRAGVSEKNETERRLVKQALKNHIKAEYAKQYNFNAM